MTSFTMALYLTGLPAMRLNLTPFSERCGSLHTSISHCISHQGVGGGAVRKRAIIRATGAWKSEHKGHAGRQLGAGGGGGGGLGGG